MNRFLVLTVLFALNASAAPVPLSSSSKAVAPFWGLYLSESGYVLDARKTGWKFSEIPEGSENAEHALRFQKALLTVRVDTNKKARNPKSYMNSWLALYNRLGFEILGNRPFTQNGETAYVLDMVRKDKGLQARQAVFFKDDKAIIVNCQDEAGAFKTSLGECNKVIRTFRWLDPAIQVPKL
jgi:hypothetical protein